MPKRKSPRKGSLQFWPRKRAEKFLPSVNWNAIDSNGLNSSSTKHKIKGFIGYKVGMMSASISDTTPNSLTIKKRIIVPATIISVPSMKIFSVRFYKQGVVASEVLSDNIDKELKKRLKLPKAKSDFSKKIEAIKSESYDDITVIAYSQVKKTGIKKTPDLIELGLNGNSNEKLNFVKENINRELNVNDVFSKGELVDVRGLTKGHGFSGTVKRYGIKLKRKKSEKGQRRPGSLGPWHPARVDFRALLAGQLGMFTRIVYNNKIIDIGNSEKGKTLNGIKNFGDVDGEYIVVKGSVQGPAKRQIIITEALRPTKKQLKKKYEFVELR